MYTAVCHRVQTRVRRVRRDHLENFLGHYAPHHSSHRMQLRVPEPAPGAYSDQPIQMRNPLIRDLHSSFNKSSMSISGCAVLKP